ncbi:N-acetyltransferase [Macrococcoides bohemicum]|uniref:N-acetyltransferase n=1 Tax=Macrococcoides bohemicum TaxID=1903056 RepID=A0AAJ4P957_9STAP|nr:N-acetyltransferase [Macrococcus bohemicus]QYA42951.1 N-acetyltransferase [Macrococcus bohemicus]TDL37542.1 N-acetyltransferase [Macrococcus bohemicus]
MHIRQATLQDLKEIMCTTELAFENELTSDNQEHTLVEELMRSDSYIPELTLVATIDNKIVGHIMYSKIKIDVYDGFAMAPLSVHPDYQKQGVGTALLHYTLSIIPLSVPVVILGHPSYYNKFGFVKASIYNIKAPFEVPDDVFMVRASEKVKEKGIQGIVIYSEAFQ